MLRALLPAEPEVAGLLALMLLTDARRPSRVAGGELVPLPEQDRGGWDRALIAEGHALVRECLDRARRTARPPGRYQLLAAVNAVHTDAPSWADTDWRQIAALYDQLAAVDPGPVVALNRAVAVAELDGPAVGLAVVDRLALTGYHAWHATRADLLRRLGRSAEARAAYDAAIAATDNPAERAFLTRRRGQLAGVMPASAQPAAGPSSAVDRMPAPPAPVGLLGRRHRAADRAQLVQPADGVARLVRGRLRRRSRGASRPPAHAHPASATGSQRDQQRDLGDLERDVDQVASRPRQVLPREHAVRTTVEPSAAPRRAAPPPAPPAPPRARSGPAAAPRPPRRAPARAAPARPG